MKNQKKNIQLSKNMDTLNRMSFLDSNSYPIVQNHYGIKYNMGGKHQ